MSYQETAKIVQVARVMGQMARIYDKRNPLTEKQADKLAEDMRRLICHYLDHDCTIKKRHPKV